ncbi:hypothetical protein [Mycobacterium bohemicum]|uniref:hypothetical protein n=1 Tax=Mycobacterium bohemicum TaxID=56425 RepID=UPI000B084EC7|nr:hypothetical protein [Mycobacterium bohemicum]MCV6969796.1 hypothetical protein [Mycobacterium bohemicum]
MATFEWNPDWEDELKRQLQPRMQKFADDHQSAMDALFERLAGRSVSEITPEVEREIASWGVSMSDGAVTRIANAISDRERVILRAG